MTTATIAQLKKELKHLSSEELERLCLRLARFKKENKELLTYLLFEAENEERYIKNVQLHIDAGFETINTKSYFYMKKTIRKVLRETKKFIRYSGNKETEVALLLYFCNKLKALKPSIKNNRVLTNLYERQLIFIEKKIEALHEDLQYDYTIELENLTA
ncbi:hypothetical protein [Patiriisocius hiemis]|uniref:Uncharacterized protein n=1 Tax=Patiriisocius hiemis TaxID=3075604 RepID=A0ABU2YA77_9FLAO|nr:hypothetical protein [Constantimarinum sp. W242]MDT0555093.1 hypothetical protein [Constantimarinum sp. W242]